MLEIIGPMFLTYLVVVPVYLAFLFVVGIFWHIVRFLQGK